MNTFDTAVDQIKKALTKSQGANVNVTLTDKQGREVYVTAFIAGGSINPGSFRSNWFIAGQKMSKEAARKFLGND